MILLIDNYDSFTYNVYQYIGSLYSQIQVVRNDEITIDEIRNLQNLEDLFRTCYLTRTWISRQCRDFKRGN